MLTGALMIHDHQITSFFIRLLPGAKPYIPLFADKSDLKAIEQQKENYSKTAYSMILARNNYTGRPLAEIKPTDTDKEIYELNHKVQTIEQKTEEKPARHNAAALGGEKVELKDIEQQLDEILG